MYEQTDTNKFPEKEKPKRNNIWDVTKKAGETFLFKNDRISFFSQH
jgi:hypothetical protein